MNRREFLAGAVSAATTSAIGVAGEGEHSGEIKAVLLHPGSNMWGDWKMPDEVAETDGREYVPDHIRFDESIWNETVAHMVEKGMNTVVMDLEELGKYSLDPKVNKHAHRLVQFRDLDKHGFDQVPRISATIRLIQNISIWKMDICQRVARRSHSGCFQCHANASFGVFRGFDLMKIIRTR